MEALHGLLIFAAAILVIFLAGRWNTSDVDHYMGFENLRPPRKAGKSPAEKKPRKK